MTSSSAASDVMVVVDVAVDNVVNVVVANVGVVVANVVIAVVVVDIVVGSF